MASGETLYVRQLTTNKVNIEYSKNPNGPFTSVIFDQAINIYRSSGTRLAYVKFLSDIEIRSKYAGMYININNVEVDGQNYKIMVQISYYINNYGGFFTGGRENVTIKKYNYVCC